MASLRATAGAGRLRVAGLALAVSQEYAQSGSERRAAMPDDRSSWAAQYIRQYCEKCPVCRSVWSKTVKRCSCGYDFQTQMMGRPSGADRRNWLWPEITDLESAAAAGRDGAAVAFVIAGITAVFAVLALFDVANVVSPWAWIDACVMALLGLFIRRMSRAAAIIAL